MNLSGATASPTSAPPPTPVLPPISAPILVPTPTMHLPNASAYNVYVRCLIGVDEGRVNHLAERLATLGYSVFIEAQGDMGGRHHPESAVLNGHPDCREAIDDIMQRRGDIVGLSALPVFRFYGDDQSPEVNNIAIQLTDDSHFPR